MYLCYIKRRMWRKTEIKAFLVRSFLHLSQWLYFSHCFWISHWLSNYPFVRVNAVLLIMWNQSFQHLEPYFSDRHYRKWVLDSLGPWPLIYFSFLFFCFSSVSRDGKSKEIFADILQRAEVSLNLLCAVPRWPGQGEGVGQITQTARRAYPAYVLPPMCDRS